MRGVVLGTISDDTSFVCLLSERIFIFCSGVVREKSFKPEILTYMVNSEIPNGRY